MSKEFLESLTQNLLEMIPKFTNINTRDAIKAVIYALENTGEENGIKFTRKTVKAVGAQVETRLR